jgi:CRISPR-associated protein Cas1
MEIAKSIADDDVEWAERCGHWLNTANEKRRRGRALRQTHEPLLLTGHGMRLRVDNGSLIVRNGFTHYPQAVDERRYFPGDRRRPSRIIVVDGSGGLSFDVLTWLAGHQIPLIQIDWRGNVVTLVGQSYGLNPKRVRWQIEAQASGRTVPIAISLIHQKFKNSITTLKTLPQSGARDRALRKHDEELEGLEHRPPRSIDALLGIEGRAAFSYSLRGNNCR